MKFNIEGKWKIWREKSKDKQACNTLSTDSLLLFHFFFVLFLRVLFGVYFYFFFISSFILHIVDYMRYVGIKYVKVVRCIVVKLLSLESEKQVFFSCKCTNTKRESKSELFSSISMDVCTIVMRCFICQVTWSCQII